MKVYSNGDLIDKEKIIELFEPGFLFGWGTFEPWRVYKSNIPFLNEHIERLNKSLKLLGIETIELNWEKIIGDLLTKNNLEDAYLRITAYKKREGTGLLIYTDTFSYYKSESYEKGFSSIISSYRRCNNNICSQVKGLSYLANRMAWYEAQKAKRDEALVLNHQDFLAGGSRSNLFLVKNKELITPPLECGAFRGITKRVVAKIAKEIGLTLREEKITSDGLFGCDEAFITSALIEVMPLVSCADKLLGEGKPGELSLKILHNYRKILS